MTTNKRVISTQENEIKTSLIPKITKISFGKLIAPDGLAERRTVEHQVEWGGLKLKF